MFARATKFSAGVGSGQIAMELTEELTEELREENEEQPQNDAPPVADDPVEMSKHERLKRLLAVDQRAAMLSAFVDLESAARDAVRQFEPDRSSRTMSFQKRIELLRQHGLSDSAAKSARYLWGIRNELTHGYAQDLRLPDAYEIVALAEELERSIRRTQLFGNSDDGVTGPT